MTTGQLIKTARKKAGLTQKELGEKLGITYQTLAQWENDLRNPKRETLQRIADALNIPIYNLMDDYSSVVRELRNGSITLDELASEMDVSEEKILSVINLEIDDPEFLQEIKKTALKLSMREENLLKLRKKMPHTDNELVYVAIDRVMRLQHPELFEYENEMNKIDAALSLLNTEGRQEAVKRVEELTEIPRYQAEKERE